jgi:hypothetical protein
MVFCRHVRKIAKSKYQFRYVCLSVRPSGRPAGLPYGATRGPTAWIFMKFDIQIFLEKSVEKIKFTKSLARIKISVRKDLCTFTAVPR